MKIIFHIGTDKTGSTAIQQHLILNREWFHSRSVYIPEIVFGRSNGHSALLSGLNDEKLSLLSKEIDCAASGGFDTILFSWEGMNFYSAEEVGRLQSVVSGHKAVVLVYLREQANIVQSGFLQQLKSADNRAPMRVFENPRFGVEMAKSQRLRYPPTRNYYKLLKRWQSKLSDVECIVGLFARDNLLNGDIVDDFLGKLGLSADKQFRRKPDTANISLDVESGILVDRWQNAGLSRDNLLRLIDVALSNIAHNGSGSKYFLSNKTVVAIRRHYQTSNRKIAREFLGSDDSLFPMPKSCSRDSSFEQLEQRADEVEKQIKRIDKTPTLSNAKAGEDKFGAVSLAQGWHRQGNGVVWSYGPTSSIRFRVWRRRIGPNCSAIRLILCGRYAGSNISTQVVINGRDFGDIAIPRQRGTELDLPLTMLLPYETIEVTLHHSKPLTPAKDKDNHDRHLIAFGLERIAYKYV